MENQAKNLQALFRVPMFFAPPSAPLLWVVSHARSGTKTLAALLNLSQEVVAYHEPVPRMWWQESSICKSTQAHLWATVFLSCRWELISQVVSYGQTYVEVNPRAVWFTHAVKTNFRNAVILRIERDRDEVIHSMYRKRMFVEGRPFEVGRPQIKAPTRREQCAKYYDMVEEFIESLPYEMRVLSFEAVRSQQIDHLMNLYDWLGVARPSEKAVRKVLDAKLNEGEKSPVLKNW